MKYLALLRGINVGGRRKVLMADLKLLFNTLGFANISTYIQSGNIFFEATEEKRVLESTITTAIINTFDFEVPVTVIEVDQLQNLVNKNPYAINSAIERLHVTFLKEKPNQELVNKIKEVDVSPDLFEVIENFVFLNIEGKYHKSKLSNNFIEKKLKVSATTRNWKTINKLIELSKK